MRRSVLLTTCVALAAMSSVAQASTLILFGNSPFPVSAPAVPITWNTLNFPGAMSTTGSIPASDALGQSTVVNVSSTGVLNSNSSSIFGNAGASINDLTIFAPEGLQFTDINFNVNISSEIPDLAVIGSDGEESHSLQVPQGSNNMVFTTDFPITSVTIAASGAPAHFSSFNFSPGANAGFTGVSVIPLPASLPLLATGLGALGLLGWRRKRKALAVA